MTTGSILYLAMTIGVMVVFSLVLGYQAWQQSRLGPDMISNSTPPKLTAEPHNAVHA